MIEQDLYIEILELFDLLKEEACFREFKRLEAMLLNNHELTNLINEYNDLIDSLAKLDYQPYIDEQQLKIDNIYIKLQQNDDYQRYLVMYEECNQRLNYIASIIFKDIVNVGEVYECSKR
ncbi:YlbF family regulator [Erysipelotrichaceae bacterium OttesenSCG-928-M19]|nr:YlbF family regulator [Erysipelotrichaceae bacterium OttesenSCG-928-M19]